MGLYSLPRSRFLGCHETLGERCVTFKKRLRGRLQGFSVFFFFVALVAVYAPLYVVTGGLCLTFIIVRSEQQSSNRILYPTWDTHVNNIISLIMHCTEYLLPVFSFAKILQLIVEIWAYLTDFWGSYVLADNWLICWLHAECMIPKSNVSPKQSNKENTY